MDTIEVQRTAGITAEPLPSLPLRLHHHAYVVKDHEANRRFIEDLLGIPLVATWCEKSHNSETGEEIEFCHAFFGLADGSALAFFGFADPKMYQRTQAKVPAEIGRYDLRTHAVDSRAGFPGQPYDVAVDGDGTAWITSSYEDHAPARNAFAMSSSVRIPPPTVSGMNNRSAVRRTRSRRVSLPSFVAAMSRKTISSAPCSS